MEERWRVSGGAGVMCVVGSHVDENASMEVGVIGRSEGREPVKARRTSKYIREAVIPAHTHAHTHIHVYMHKLNNVMKHM